jgi:hypothetical protein
MFVPIFVNSPSHILCIEDVHVQRLFRVYIVKTINHFLMKQLEGQHCDLFENDEMIKEEVLYVLSITKTVSFL